ncbi:MAG: hypothetical protein D8M57_00275 [Candidatus Scalindua sp. AMX11]|nr:MAG: hypothetical protein DWQ00_18710 [Candidatus Scalindua sp.]NOG84143.1 hypothetical protein [Planctomycetota bacterium]RZV98949.1 MAG: hypothetical protein EX341_00630 [Candidatus Scalindua sp. SCAELEC01]TDE66860.1 MAG: hypothetical protein D8M57_00275 [Candidatus Scalindua sp. AMX11]GJQ57660.1 MAG: hypothetical protein SCALA701_04610 [Candidatus Scalindua sp.]
MKRKEFVKQLFREGCLFLRSGANHDIYINPDNNLRQGKRVLATNSITSGHAYIVESGAVVTFKAGNIISLQ